MNDSDFDKLCESIKQAGEIKRGARKPSQDFQSVAPDVKFTYQSSKGDSRESPKIRS